MVLILKNWSIKNELKHVLILKIVCPITICILVSHSQAALVSHITMDNRDGSSTQTSHSNLGPRSKGPTPESSPVKTLPMRWGRRVHAKSLQPCLTLCDFMDYSLAPYSSLLAPWDSPGKNTGVGCHALLQGILWPRDRTRVSYISCIGRQVMAKKIHPLKTHTSLF